MPRTAHSVFTKMGSTTDPGPHSEEQRTLANQYRIDWDRVEYRAGRSFTQTERWDVIGTIGQYYAKRSGSRVTPAQLSPALKKLRAAEQELAKLPEQLCVPGGLQILSQMTAILEARSLPREDAPISPRRHLIISLLDKLGYSSEDLPKTVATANTLSLPEAYVVIRAILEEAALDEPHNGVKGHSDESFSREMVRVIETWQSITDNE